MGYLKCVKNGLLSAILHTHTHTHEYIHEQSMKHISLKKSRLLEESDVVQVTHYVHRILSQLIPQLSYCSHPRPATLHHATLVSNLSL